MNKARETLLRRTATILALIGVVLMVLGGLFGGGATILISGIAAVLAVAAWGVALTLSLLARHIEWLGFLGVSALAGVILGVLQLGVYTQTEPRTVALIQVTFLSFAFSAFVAAVVSTVSAFDRVPAAVTGAIALGALIIGGTMLGGAVGNAEAGVPQHFIEFGFHLYLLSGLFATLTWILGMVAGFRSRAWGWFVATIILPGIGSFMFGLFGPTRLDVKLAQEDRRARRAAGVA